MDIDLLDPADDAQSLHDALVAAAQVERRVLWFMDPNYILYMVYAMHTLTDKHRAAFTPDPSAVRAVARFNRVASLPWKLLSPEFTLLVTIEPIMNSLINDVRKRKDSNLKDIEQAFHDFEEAKRTQNRTEVVTQPPKVLYRTAKQFLTPLAMTLLGVVIAQGTQPFVPDKVSEGTGVVWPTIAAGAIFLALTNLFSVWMNNLRVARLHKTLNERGSAAQIRYDHERENINKASWPLLVKAYEAYTGVPYEEPMHYGSVFMNDLLQHTAKRDLMREHRASILIVAIRMILQACARCFPKRSPKKE